MNDNVIRLDNVSKFYKLYDSPKIRLKEALHPFGKKYHKEFYAIRDISLQVGRGEVLGIVGRNGSGKSTLLKLISNIIVPSSGNVSVDGNINALLELGSGLNPDFTGLQNIYFMGSINGISKEEMGGKVEEIVNFSELGEFIHQPLKSYSSGMKSRLAFGIATTITPEVLILDEVLSVGDALFRRKSFAKMEQLIAENRTVLFVSHNEQSIKSICTKAILLDQGRLLYKGKPDDTVNLYLELLHSKDKDKVIESKILNKQSSSSTDVDISVSNANQKVESGIQEENIPSKEVGDKVIQTKSKEYVRLHDADIKDITVVEELSGSEVKILETGKKYFVMITSRIGDKINNVTAALSIVNEKGIMITGCSPRLKGESVNNDDSEIVIKFQFLLDCKLLPSYYYVGSAVYGDVDGKNEMLCYVRDAIALKIVSGEKGKSDKFGIVDLINYENYKIS